MKLGVSVVLSNFNGAPFLDQCIQSVALQSFPSWELIVVDTGSSDASQTIVERWTKRDNRVRSVLIPYRMSCPIALNIGIQAANGDFIARVESDDLWNSNRLERQLQVFSDDPSIALCGSDATLINGHGKPIGLKRFPRSHDECLSALWYRNPFCHSSVIAKREVFLRAGLYDNRYPLAEDLELWFRVLRDFRVCNVPEPLVSYRVWNGSWTSKGLRRMIWSTFKVRCNAVGDLRYQRPAGAAMFSLATLSAMVLPSVIARVLFQKLLEVTDTHVHSAEGAYR